jgi:hypothetical protein
MAAISVTVRIGALVAPRGHGLDHDDLRARVEAELHGLLAREPLRHPPDDGVVVSMPGGQIVPASLNSPSAVAYAIARRIHDRLSEPETWR